MGKFLAGLILGLIIIPVCVLVYFVSGMVPVATSAQAMPFEKQMARIGLNAHVEKEAPKSAPFQPAEDDYVEGAKIFRSDCAVCHGLPNQQQTPVAKGMFPHPPQLWRGNGVTDDPPGETFWKVENGIRLTGMPGYSQSLSQKQLWQVSFLLANADKLSDAVKQELAQPPAGEGVTQPANPSTATPSPAPPTPSKKK
jgi:mono/diheme cytochrome c family protein